MRKYVQIVSENTLARAKVAYSCRRVELARAVYLSETPRKLCAGDLLLARIRSMGHHKRLELTDGRRARLLLVT